MKIFITGATSGIGLSLAKLYLSEGHEVGICGRDLSKLPEGFFINYPRVKTYEVDVLNTKNLHECIIEFSKKGIHKGLDLLIANAGRSHGTKTKLPDFEVSKNIIEVNVIGVFNSFAPAVEIMAEQGYGHIAAVSSVAGFVGLPGSAAYSASKAAVLKLCESYRMDLKKTGISVTAIAPGFINTPLTKHNDHVMPWMMSSEKSALIIKKALVKKTALLVFPWQMKLVIMILDKIPRSLYRLIMSVSYFNYSQK